MPVTVVSLAETLTILLTTLKSIGWFAETHWPQEVDNLHNQLIQMPGVNIEKLKDLREEAHKYYLKHHHAAPWDKPRYLSKFGNAVNEWIATLQDEAKRLKKEKEEEEGVTYVATFWGKYKKYLLYVGGGGLAVLGAILYFKRKR